MRPSKHPARGGGCAGAGPPGGPAPGRAAGDAEAAVRRHRMLRNTEGSIWPASRTPSSTGVSKARCSGVKLYAPSASATPVRSRRSWAAARDADGAAGDAGGAAAEAAAGQGGLGGGGGHRGDPHPPDLVHLPPALYGPGGRRRRRRGRRHRAPPTAEGRCGRAVRRNGEARGAHAPEGSVPRRVARLRRVAGGAVEEAAGGAHHRCGVENAIR